MFRRRVRFTGMITAERAQNNQHTAIYIGIVRHRK